VSIDEQREPGAAERASPERAVERTSGLSPRRILGIMVVSIIVLDVLAFVFVPPYPKGEPGHPVSGIGDLIRANIELPAPQVVWDFAPNDPVASSAIVFFHPSISSTLFTMWLLMIVIVAVVFLATRGMRLVPRPVQNVTEFVYELLENFAVSLGGDAARPYVPVFAGFFLFILVSNWSGLLPIVGKFEELRAPTSDVNVTIGLALCAFIYFEYQGFRRLGVRGYLGKFFVFSGFRQGIGTGLLDLFVGLIEFMLELIKPVTLSMRLFGNILGGEIALGVITALTIAVVPVLMYGLEALLNFVQALIFSTLTLMFTLIAIESHEEEAHAAPELADIPEGNIGPPLSGMQPGSAH